MEFKQMPERNKNKTELDVSLRLNNKDNQTVEVLNDSLRSFLTNCWIGLLLAIIATSTISLSLLLGDRVSFVFTRNNQVKSIGIVFISIICLMSVLWIYFYFYTEKLIKLMFYKNSENQKAIKRVLINLRMLVYILVVYWGMFIIILSACYLGLVIG